MVLCWLVFWDALLGASSYAVSTLGTDGLFLRLRFLVGDAIWQDSGCSAESIRVVWSVSPAWEAVELTLGDRLHLLVRGPRPYWFGSVGIGAKKRGGGDRRVYCPIAWGTILVPLAAWQLLCPAAASLPWGHFGSKTRPRVAEIFRWNLTWSSGMMQEVWSSGMMHVYIYTLYFYVQTACFLKKQIFSGSWPVVCTCLCPNIPGV